MIKYNKNIKRYTINLFGKFVSEDADGNLSLTKDKSFAMVFKRRKDARCGLLKYLKNK